MIKNIAIWKPEKNADKIEVHIREPSSHADLFDSGFELMQFAIAGMQEIAKQNQPQEPKQEETPKVE